MTHIATEGEWVYYEGRDPQEQIRSLIKYFHDHHHTDWVLLGGNNDVVRYRYVHSDMSGPGIDLISDYYYACLDGNWNADGDQYFGGS